MRKIKQACELPEWFELSNYEYLQGLTALGWSVVVRELLALYELTAEELEADQLEEEGLTVEQLLSELLIKEVANHPSHGRNLWAYRADPERFNFRGVSSVSNSVVAYMAATLESLELGPEAISFNDAIRERRRKSGGKKSRKSPPKLTPELGEFLRKPFFLSVRDAFSAESRAEDLTPNRAISVNMSLPDSLLIDDFKDWLRATRKLDYHKAAPKAFDEHDYAKWFDDRYVPLLLLTAWAKLSGVEITNAALAEALFPTRRRISESNIRRSIRPAAQAWLCGEIAEALAAQAAKEDRADLPTNEDLPF